MKSAMLPAHVAIIVDDDKDVNSILSATLKLKKFDVHKVYNAEECLNKLNELEGKVADYGRCLTVVKVTIGSL
jgi:DNA-binding NtrC family response regulator